MTKKKDMRQPPKEIARSIRFSQEDLDAVERVAIRLHREGIPGLLGQDGGVVFTAVIRRLIHGVDEGQLILKK